MSNRFAEVLQSMSAPPRADFICTAIQCGQFQTHELLELFGEEMVVATLRLALEYIDAGSILVLSSRRDPYLKLLDEIAAMRTRTCVAQGASDDSMR